ncbi:MAG: hypothetical protein RLZZ399_679 [Verrucomicrobiota bacterium]
MTRILRTITASALLCSAFPACIVLGNRLNDNPPRNVGGELLDLKKAKDAGLISNAEFKERRDKIISETKAKPETPSETKKK